MHSGQAPCPNDTNGDGDCGRPMCPYCALAADSRALREALAEIARFTEPLALMLAMGGRVSADELLPEVQRVNRILRAALHPSTPTSFGETARELLREIDRLRSTPDRAEADDAAR